MTTETKTPLVSVRDLSVKFVSREATVNAVNDVSLTVQHGEVQYHQRVRARAKASACGR